MVDYGVWGADGHCHAFDCTRDQALIVGGRCDRLIKQFGPFFIGRVAEAKAQGFKNHRGEVL